MTALSWPARAADLCERTGDPALAAILRRAGTDPASRRLLLHDSRVQRVLTRLLAADPVQLPAAAPARSAAERADLMRRNGLGAQLDALRATWTAVATGADPALTAVADAVLAANPQPAATPPTPRVDDSDDDEGGWVRR